MLTADLTRLYPELYHMAAADSWPSIARHGLLCTRDLVDAWQVESPATRAALLEQRRPQSIVVEHPEFGAATIRDHGPLNTASLAEALDGMTVEQWFAVLNERVFFFLQRKRLDALLGAYKREPQLVITLDTASLVAAYESRIELCKFNSGFAQPHNKKTAQQRIVPTDRRLSAPTAHRRKPQRRGCRGTHRPRLRRRAAARDSRGAGVRGSCLATCCNEFT
jgi:hypothetical protein